MGHESGERDRERDWGEREKERECTAAKERVCCKGTGRVGRERKRESGEYVRRVRERVCLEMHGGDRERESGRWVKDRKRLSERRKVKHRNGGRKKKKRGLKGDNESEAKGRDCGESVSPSSRHLYARKSYEGLDQPTNFQTSRPKSNAWSFHPKSDKKS